MTEVLIEVSSLTVRYGDVIAVDDLSFTASRGQIVALLGPNGAGKTSTVETLEGFRRPTGGVVRVCGLDPVADHSELTRSIGVMLQDGGVYPGMRPLEVLKLFAAYYDEPADPDELLNQVGLRSRMSTTWRHLSGGERQRLSLALALVGRPSVAFLDEPTAGIDLAGRQLIREVITGLRDRGTCVLLTTHDLDEAEKLADNVLIIDHGRLLAAGPPRELMHSPGGEIRFSAPPGIDTASLAAAVGVRVTEISPGEYRAASPPAPGPVAAITGWLAQHDLHLGDLRAGRQRLEDVFVRLTTEAGREREAGGGREAGKVARGGRGRRGEEPNGDAGRRWRRPRR